MTEARITKIVCPSCESTGRFGRNSVLDIACMWCRGAIRIPVAKARHYADHIYMIAVGGFVAGDHDYGYKLEMELRAERIYALTGDVAPWRHPAPIETSGAYPAALEKETRG